MANLIACCVVHAGQHSRAQRGSAADRDIRCNLAARIWQFFQVILTTSRAARRAAPWERTTKEQWLLPRKCRYPRKGRRTGAKTCMLPLSLRPPMRITGSASVHARWWPHLHVDVHCHLELCIELHFGLICAGGQQSKQRSSSKRLLVTPVMVFAFLDVTVLLLVFIFQ